MRILILLFLLFISINCFAAYQYNVKGNQSWITFDSETTLSLDVSRSGKDKEHENFIDKGHGIIDFGWYNLDTDEFGSFNNGMNATFSEDDKIGLFVTDNSGNTYTTTKSNSLFENGVWGKSKIINGALIVGGGNLGSNGTHEYYVFNITSENQVQPNGQPLPGIFATIVIGFTCGFYLRNRKRYLQA